MHSTYGGVRVGTCVGMPVTGKGQVVDLGVGGEVGCPGVGQEMAVEVELGKQVA